MPRLKQLAADIERLFPDLVALVYPANHPLGGYCNTDRNIPGTRLRRPGKGRRGTRLVVSWRPGHEPACVGGGVHQAGSDCRICGVKTIVMEHNAAETYRTNDDVRRWIDSEQRRRAKGK